MSCPSPKILLKEAHPGHGDLFPWAKQFDEIFHSPLTSTALELGAFTGFCSAYVGNIMKRRGGRLDVVDTWRVDTRLHLLPTNVLHKLGQLAWHIPGEGDIYEQFLSNMYHAGVESVVTPYRMTTVEAQEKLPGPYHVIYLDADLSYEATIRDITAWWPRVKRGGVMLGGDYRPGKEYQEPNIGASEAWREFCGKHGLKAEVHTVRTRRLIVVHKSHRM